jgi:hypothetical protein
MPSTKAMENKTLSARCANPECGKQLSTELMVGLAVGPMGRRRQITICTPCAERGWRPTETPPAVVAAKP